MQTVSADLPQLWARVRGAYQRASADLGGPAGIAAMGALTRRLRRRIVHWIGLLEHLARKLIFAEAARLAPGASAARKACAPCAARGAREIDLSAPHTWPARFSFAIPRDPQLAAPDAAPRIRALWGQATPPAQPLAEKPRARGESAFLLARRFEALRRVIENPHPHALRLARLMPRLLRRFPRAAHHIAMQPQNAGGYDPADPRLGIDCCSRALEAQPAFNTS